MMASPATEFELEVRSWPRLTRFYGIGPLELFALPRPVTRIYAEALRELEAEEQLARFQAADWPYHSGTKRKGIMRRIFSPDEQPPEDAVTRLDPVEDQVVLAGIGIRVVTEDA
jgi:hypothetical protein